MSGKIRECIEAIIKKRQGWFTVAAIAKEANINWATSRTYLLQLLAKGLIEGEELPDRGWIFRAKRPVAVPA